MWFENQFFSADSDKGGKIIVPYGNIRIGRRAILITPGFAQLKSFTRKSESYSFDCSYILNHESLLFEKEAELIIKPILKINGNVCSLNVLKNTKVTLTTTSFVDDLSTTKTFDGLKSSNQKDISIKFQVPPNLASVSILVETEIKNISKRTSEKFSNSHKIMLATNNHDLRFYDCYFRKFKGEYYYYLLGKNGEPITGASVSFTFEHKVFNLESKDLMLDTDQDGKINLGHLTDINNVSANFNGPNGT
jgi:hypothetical protein